MGSVPKCLLSLDGVPLVHRHLQALRETGVHDVVVVTGYHHERIEPVIGSTGAITVRNPHPERGQQTSVRIGMEALGSGYDLVIVALADQPLVGSAELTELVSAFKSRATGTQVVYPSVQGKRGNPVIFSGELVDQMLANQSEIAPRKLIDQHPELVHLHQTANDRFIFDLDTRDDIHEFEKRTGMKLVMPMPSMS